MERARTSCAMPYARARRRLRERERGREREREKDCPLQTLTLIPFRRDAWPPTPTPLSAPASCGRARRTSG